MAKPDLINYTNDPIKKGDMVQLVDLTEVKINTEKLLESLISHKGTTSSSSSVEHQEVSSASSGFAPSTLNNRIIERSAEIALIEESLKNDDYPEYSIVLWHGTKNDSMLPEGWIWCDGESKYIFDGKEYTAPDMRYTIPVAATDVRPLLSRHPAATRNNIAYPSTDKKDLDEAITYWYIMKKPRTVKPLDLVSLTVTQPTRLYVLGSTVYPPRIATNFTENNEYILNLKQDGDSETVLIPRNSRVRVDITSVPAYITTLYSNVGGSKTKIAPGSTITVSSNTTLTAELTTTPVPTGGVAWVGGSRDPISGVTTYGGYKPDNPVPLTIPPWVKVVHVNFTWHWGGDEHGYPGQICKDIDTGISWHPYKNNGGSGVAPGSGGFLVAVTPGKTYRLEVWRGSYKNRDYGPIVRWSESINQMTPTISDL